MNGRHAPTIPAEVEQGVGYMTRGGQSTLMPASPITGQAVTFSDLDNDWSETNFLTLDGNGNTFTQGSQTTYDLDLKGAFAQFAYLDGQWQIVNFGRLSDAYGFDLDDYATLNLVNSKPNANLLINGGFDIWQRGTSFTGNGDRYTADRWGANSTVDSVDRVEANINGIDGYALEYSTSSNGSIIYPVELTEAGKADVFTTGNTFTISGYVKGANAVFELVTLFRDNPFTGSQQSCRSGCHVINFRWDLAILFIYLGYQCLA